MLEIEVFNKKFVELSKGDFWKDEGLFHLIEKVGFRNVDWNNIPDNVLFYLFIHDQPTIGEKRADSTKKEYLRDLNQFTAYLYNEGINSIRTLHPEQLLQFQRHLESKYKNTTFLRKSSVIKHFFRYLANKKILQEDITLQMKKPKIKTEELINRDLYDYEVEQLLKYFKSTDWFAYTLFYLLVSTGMRINELATAHWSNLRYEPSVGYYFLKVTGKRNKSRDVVIFNDVMDVALENRRRKSLSTQIGKFDGTAFFPKASGEFYNSTYLSNEFTRLVSAAPFEFIKNRFEKEKVPDKKGNYIRHRITPHTCRHYTAAFYMDNGIDPKAIQDLLGHKNFITTAGYLRRKRSIKDHAAVKLGEKNFLNKLNKQI